MFRNPHLQLHLCVLLWGFTAILGKVITLSAIPLVFWRVLIVSLCLCLWLPVWRQLAGLTRRDIGIAAVNGVVITVHWLCFYGAVKMANASVAATCLALAPIFLALFGPLLQRKRFVARDLLVAVIALPGVALVVGGIPHDMRGGFALGALAALLAALFSSINQGLAQRMPALALTHIQMSSGALLLGLTIPFWPLAGINFAWPQPTDLGWLLVLALACTLVPFALIVVVLRRISAFGVQLAVNLEPVYAIALAALLLGEGAELRWPFYAGVALIVGAVFGYVALHRRGSSLPDPLIG